MNQSNNKLNNNNKIIVNKNTRKRFFILVGGITVLFILLGIFFLVKKVKSQDKNEQKTKKESLEEKSNEEGDDKWRCKKCLISKFKNCEHSGEKNNCPYLNESVLTTNPEEKRSKLTMREEELAEWKKIPQDYVVKLWKKGYHWRDILQLWGWKLSETEIPDLKIEQKVGVINCLSWTFVPISIIEDKSISKEEILKMAEEDRFGQAKDLVIIVRKATEPRINIDKWVQGASPFGNTYKYVKKLINFTLNQENINPSQYEIFLLEAMGAERFGKEENSGLIIGKSFGSAIYLALLSALHQKPISKTVAATGTINTSNQEKKGKISDQEVSIVKGDNLPVCGLKGKSYAAVEKGVKHLLLSAYNTSPRLLNFSYKNKSPDRQVVDEKWGTTEDYLKVVPPEIEKKLTVHWTKNIVELKELLFSGKLD